MDWIEFGNRFGIPLLVLAGVAWFVVRYAWPFITTQAWPFIIKQVEDFKKEREAERNQFLKERETERIQFLSSMELLTKERQSERIAFLAAMDSRDKQFAPVVESLDKLHDLVSTRMDAVSIALSKIDNRKR